MVNIIPRAPSFAEEFARNLGAGASKGVSQATDLMGDVYKQKSKFANEFAADEDSYSKIKDVFGEKFANVWRASPTGARTELTKSALDARARGINLDEVLQGSQQESNQPMKNASKMEEGKLPEYKLNISGMNKPEQVKFKSELRKENTPIWKENADNHKSFKTMGRDIKMLSNLNKKGNLPEGLGKLLIDPETGNFYPAVTAIHKPNPDAQLWVKILARQATKAQTAFPGRVTNFDLQSFMLQFPSLFNTEEGRTNILQMMELDNQANELFSKALDDVYRKYKADGITPEDAHSMAMDMVQKDIDTIDQKLIDLSAQAERKMQNNDGNSSPKSRTIDVIGPDGQEYELDESEVEMLPPGFKLK